MAIAAGIGVSMLVACASTEEVAEAPEEPLNPMRLEVSSAPVTRWDFTFRHFMVPHGPLPDPLPEPVGERTTIRRQVEWNHRVYANRRAEVEPLLNQWFRGAYPEDFFEFVEAVSARQLKDEIRDVRAALAFLRKHGHKAGFFLQGTKEMLDRFNEDLRKRDALDRIERLWFGYRWQNLTIRGREPSLIEPSLYRIDIHHPWPEKTLELAKRYFGVSTTADLLLTEDPPLWVLFITIDSDRKITRIKVK